ncbi:1162_t:CDS:2, partial [Gigaspora rosea]
MCKANITKKAKFTALEHVNSNNYKDDFYESNDKCFVSHAKLLIILENPYGNHFNSALHQKRKCLIESSSSNLSQLNLEQQDINVVLANAFAKADIPLEKLINYRCFLRNTILK